MKSAKFKDSPLGPIPQDWEVKRLGDCVALVTKGTTPTSIGCEFTRSGITFIKAESIADNGSLIPSMFAYINEQTHEVLRRSQLKENDILFSIAGVLGRVGMVVKEVLPANTNQALAIIRPNIDGEVDIKFLFYCLQAEYIARAINQLQIGVAQANLSLENVKELWLSLPPLPEQQRIAEALGEVDKLIESLDEQIEKKRLIAKGVAHDLLSGKKRLPGFKGAWKSVRLGAIGELYGGLSGKTADDFGHGTARFITFLNVLNNVTIDKDMVGEVDVRFGEKQHAVRKGDLFFNVSSETPEEVAMCAALMEDMPNTYLNSFCCGFRLNKPDHNPLFISYYFNSNIGRDALRGIASGITRYNLSKKAFREKMLVWPKCSEQRAIAEVLSEMDASITALEAKREKYAYIKEGMMRDLLTGKVRMKGE